MGPKGKLDVAASFMFNKSTTMTGTPATAQGPAISMVKASPMDSNIFKGTGRKLPINNSYIKSTSLSYSK
jgi:hypothetical protein